MDGLSVAASIVGVISLAMQLSQTTRRLIAFLEDVREAPKEILRLNELLKLIFAMSAGVVNALECQRRKFGDSALGHEHLRDVLVVCLRKLTSIRDIMEISEVSQQRGNLASKSWARLKLSFKMDEILELERQLGQSLQVLNIALTTSLFYETALRSQHTGVVDCSDSAALTVAVPRQENVISDSIQLPSTRLIDSAALETKSSIVSTSTSHSHTSYSWPSIVYTSYNATTIRRRHRQGSARIREMATNSTKTSYRIAVVFLSASIEFTSHKLASCSPVFSLRVRHVVPSKTYWTQVFPVLSRGGLDEFLQLLKNGICTINSVIDGLDLRSIVELAEGIGNSAIAEFLHSQGCDFEAGSIHWVLRSRKSSSRFRSVISRLDLAGHDLDDIIPTYRSYGVAQTLDAVEWFTSTGVHMTAQVKEEYLGSLLCLLCTQWDAAVTTQSQKDRDALVLKLIKNGANVHHLESTGLTPLLCLMRHIILGPHSSALSGWLTLLEHGQIDLRHYLERESELFPQPFELYWQVVRYSPHTYTCFTPRKVSVDVLDTLMSKVSYPDMQYFDLNSTAPQLFEQFNFAPNLRIGSGTGCKHMKYWFGLWKGDAKNNTQGRSIRQLLAQWVSANSIQKQTENEIWRETRDWPWNGNMQSFVNTRGVDRAKLARGIISSQTLCECDASGQYLALWPFNGNTHTLCQTGNLTGRPCLNKSTWCWVHGCRFNHERFARKQEKKRLKQMRMLGLKTKFYAPPMPGKWVD